MTDRLTKTDLAILERDLKDRFAGPRSSSPS
jgi:hypothetical protein